jgi:hypothetical protein
MVLENTGEESVEGDERELAGVREGWTWEGGVRDLGGEAWTKDLKSQSGGYEARQDGQGRGRR